MLCTGVNVGEITRRLTLWVLLVNGCVVADPFELFGATIVIVVTVASCPVVSIKLTLLSGE